MAGHQRNRSRIAILGLAIAGVAVILTGAAIGMASPAVYSFGGSPAAPLPLGGPTSTVLSAFDVQVHSRDQSTWYALESMQAQHGAACDAPPATHENSTYEGAVFQCKNHVMTNIKAGGYGEIILTPDAMVDFSGGTGVISWDVSTERMSNRDWFDVWVTPFADNMPLPLQSWLPDLNGPPRNAIHAALGPDNNLCPTIYRDFNESPLVAGYGNGCNWWTGYQSILTPSATVRTTFRIEVSQTHLKVWIPPQASTNNQSLVWFDGPIPGGLPFNKAVVQFGHHSYNPEKTDGCGVGSTPCKAGTWHWNNISISPSVPFTMIKANRRFANAANPAITFNAPAPANAFLRFSGHESKVEASYNGGPYQLLAERPNIKGNGGEFGQFFSPVPAGTTNVTFRVTPGWVGEWILQDFGIWSEGGAATVSTATSSATPTKAAVTATATPTTPGTTVTVTTPVATATPTVVRSTATHTAVPPTASATPVPPTVGAKTVPPTSTPTAIPPTPASPAVASAEIPDVWLAGAVLSNTSLLAGSRLWMTASVTSPIGTNALIDVEIYSPSGQKVYQRYYDGRSFNAGDSRTFTSAWLIPRSAATGTYTVKIGVFKVGWAGLFAWEDQAARFTVR